MSWQAHPAVDISKPISGFQQRSVKVSRKIARCWATFSANSHPSEFSWNVLDRIVDFFVDSPSLRDVNAAISPIDQLSPQTAPISLLFNPSRQPQRIRSRPFPSTRASTSSNDILPTIAISTRSQWVLLRLRPPTTSFRGILDSIGVI